MITVLEQSKPWEPEIGDIISDGSKFVERLYITEKDEDLIRGKKFVLLYLIAMNTWEALKKVGVDIQGVKEAFAYSCPYTENSFFHFVPHLILTDDQTPYGFNGDLKSHDSYPFDSDWLRRMDLGMGQEEMNPPEFNMTSIQTALSGPGYTNGCSNWDGHGDWKLAFLQLKTTGSQKDLLLGWVHVWYNK